MTANPSFWGVDFAEYSASRWSWRAPKVGSAIIRTWRSMAPMKSTPFDRDTRVNPRLVVEVTSKSTEKKDRGVKLEDYLQVESLEEYLIVSHERREVELWSRAERRWQRHLATEGALRLRCGAAVDVARMYEGSPD